MSASSIPLKIKNSNGDLQEFTPAQESYLAYAVGQALAEASAGDVGNISLTDGNSIGSFTDAYYNEPAGTHPLSNLTSTTTTTTLKQVAGPADESGADFTRPVGYYENGPNPGFYEMVDADLDNLAGRVLGNMAQNNYTGTFKLAKTSPGADYSVFIENAFSDTHGDGTVENYSIYQRVTMPAVNAHRPVAVCYDDDASVAVNLSDVSSLNLYRGQDTVITAASTDSNGGAITWSFGEVLSGTSYVVVSAQGDDDNGAGSGSVYVYDANDLSASPTKLTAFDGTADDQFGISVAVTADKIIVGAAGDDDRGSMSGSVYVFDTNDLSATPTKLTAFDGTARDFFGNSVAATSDKIIVSAQGDDDKGSMSGSVYVFDANDLSAQPTKLTAFDGAAGDQFGRNSVAATADKIIVGAYYDDDNGSASGSVYVYDANDLSAQPTKLTAFDGDTEDNFGYSVAVTADKIIVGAMGDGDNGAYSGSVYVYDINDLSASPTKLTAYDGAARDQFGTSVAATADKIVVGARQDDDNGSGSGSVYVYDANDLSAQPTKLTAFDGAEYDSFGYSVDTINDKIFVGAWGDADNGTNTGSVYVYDANDLSASPTKLTAFDGAANDNFGYSVAAISAPSALNGVTVTQSDNVFTVTPGSSAASFKLRFSGDVTKDVDFTVSAAKKFDGFKEMTDAQIKYSLGQRVKSLRATAGAIGSYQLRSSAQGAPIMPGTWLSAGTATNTRRTLVDTAYTRTRNSSYVRSRVSAYTRDRISTFTRNRVDSFARAFTGDYTGAYTRGFTGNYSRDFTGNYARTRISTFDGTYTRGRLSTYAADYVRSRVSTYDGTYSRNRISTYTRESTRARNSAYSQAFSRTRASAYIADYTRARTSTYDGTYTRDRVSSYIDTYTRTRPSTFAGNYTTARTSTYDGTYSRTRNSSFSGTYSRERVSSYAGTYTRERASTYTGEYTRARTSTFDGTYSQLRTSSFADTYARTRTSTYDGTYARTRTSTYDGTYARTRVSSYVQDYTRTRVSAYAATYTRERPSSYSGDYTRARTSTFDGTFSRTRNSSYSGTYSRTRVSSYIDTYSRARISTYAGTYARNRVSAYSGTYARTRNSIYTGAYSRTRTSTYDGTYSRIRNSAFAADYMRTRTSAYGATYSRVRASAYTRTRLTAFTNSYSGTYSRSRVSVYTRDRVTNFAGIFARTRTSSYTRGRVSTYSGTYARARTSAYSATYSRTRVSSYTGTYAGTYSRNRVSAYAGTYSRSRNSVYTRTSTRTRNSSYSADYTRTRVTDYTRNRVTNFAGVFSRARVSTYARTRTSVYSAAYARDRVSSYVRATRTANYTGNFVGNYSRNFAGNYSRNFVGNYSRGFAGNYVGNYARVSTIVSARTRYSAYARTSTRTRASAYTRDRVTNFAGNFVGNYSRNFAGDFVGNYSRTFVGDYTGNYTGNYATTFTGDFVGNYARAFVGDFAGNYTGNYTTTFTGDFVGNYARNFVGNYVGNFVGNYARGFAGNYAGDYTGNYATTFTGNFVGNYARGFAGNFAGDFVGNYARTSTRTSTRVLDYTRTSTRTSTRTLVYSRPLNFAGDFVGNYARNYSAAYTRTPAYTRTLYYAGDFVGNYARTRTGNYTGNYARTRVTNYAGNFVGNYGRTRTGNYTGNYSRDRVTNYAGNFVGNYTRGATYTGNYVGNVTYVGNYTGTVAYTRTRTVTSTQAATFTRTSTRASTRTSTRTSTGTGGTNTNVYNGNYFGVITGWVRDTEGGVETNMVYINGSLVAYSPLATISLVAGGVTYYRGSLQEVFGFEQRYGVSYNSSSNYTGNYTGDFTGNFVGDYVGTTATSNDYVGNYSRNVNYTRNRAAAVDYTRNRASTLTYTRDRVTNFAGNFVGNYSRNRAFSYAGNYSRDRVTNFAGNFVGDYARNRAFSYEGNYARTSTRTSTNTGYYTRTLSYTGDYARAFTRTSTRTSARTDNYTRTGYYAGDFVGNYTRTGYYAGDFVGEYARTSTRTSTRTRYSAYARTRVTNYIGDFSRVSTRTSTRTRYSAYARTRATDYTRTRNSAYARTRITNYVGNFTRVSTRTSTRTRYSAYARTRITNYVGDFTRVSTRNSTRNRGSAYARTSTRTRASAYTRDRVTNFAGNFVGNYSRNFAGDFVGNYARGFVGEYTGNYTGEYTRTSTRTRYSAYARTRLSTYVGQYANSYTRHRMDSYSRNLSVTTSFNDGFGSSNLIGTGQYAPDGSTFGDWNHNEPHANGTSANWYNIGSGNTFELVDTPYGTDVVWQAKGTPDANDGDGGFYSKPVSIDNTKTYRYSVWVRRPVHGNGNFYLGAASRWDVHNTPAATGSDIIKHLSSGGTTVNPYFWAFDWNTSGTDSVGTDLLEGQGNFSGGNAPVSAVSGTHNPDNNIIQMNGPSGSGYVLAQTPTTPVGTPDYTEYQLTITDKMEANKTYRMSGWYAESSDYVGSERMFHARTYSSSGSHLSTGSGLYEVTETKVIDGVTWKYAQAFINTPADFTGTFEWYVGYDGSDFQGTRYFDGLKIEPVESDWFLVVGHVHPAGTTVGSAKHPDTAVYNSSGEVVHTGTNSNDFIFGSTQTVCGVRNWLYYATDSQTVQQMYMPRIDDLSNSSAPSISDLINGAPSRSVVFTGNYTGNYSRGFVGNYSRNFSGQYSRNFAGDFAGNYVGNFAGNYVGNYSRGFAGNYAGNFSRNFAGEYVGNYSRGFAGEYTGAYSGTYSRDFSGQYVGNYSRNFAGEYTGTYSNTFTGNYSRNFAGNYARDFAGNFVGNYARTFAGEYTGAYTRDFVGNFAGNYSRGFAGEYAGTYTRDFGGNYVGNYSRGFSGQYTGTFSRDFVGDYTGAYSRGFVGEYTGAYTRGFAGEYAGAYTRAFSGQYVGNYSRDFSGQYGGTYSRDFVGEYTGTFTGPEATAYQSNLGIRDSGDLFFGNNSDAQALRDSIFTQVSASGVNKMEVYWGGNLIYAIQHPSSADLNPVSPRDHNSIYGGYGINIAGGGGVQQVQNVHTHSAKSVYGVANSSNHYSFDTIKTYDSSGSLISSVEYTSNLTSNLVPVPNGTLGFVGNYTGAYTRNITDSFVGNYSRNFAGEYAGNYARGFTGEYTGTYSNDFVGQYTGTYSRDFVGEYVGNYSRDFAGEYTGTFTGPVVYAEVPESTYGIRRSSGFSVGSQYYRYFRSSQLTANVTGQLNGIVSQINGTVAATKVEFWSGSILLYAVNANSGGSLDSYLNHDGGGLATDLIIKGNAFQSGTVGLPMTDNSSVAAPSAYQLNGQIDGSGNAISSPTLLSYDTVKVYNDNGLQSSVEYTSNLTGNNVATSSIEAVGFVGNYTGAYTRNITDAYTGAYTRNFTGEYTGAYSRGFSGQYTGTFSRDFTGDFVGNYSRDFSGQYVGNYSRGFAGEYTGTFTGPVFPIVELVNQGDFENNSSNNGQFPAGWQNMNFPNTEPQITTAYNNGEKRLRIQFYTSTPLINNQRVMRQTISGLTPGREYELKIWAYDTMSVSDGAGGSIENPPALELVHGSTSEFVGEGLSARSHNSPPYNSDSVTFIASATTATLYVLRAVGIVSDISLKATEVVTGFAGNYVGNYSRDFVGEYTGNFSRDFAGEYTGNYSRSFSGQYTGTFSSYFTGNYTGNYSRTFAGEYTGTYSGPDVYGQLPESTYGFGPGFAGTGGGTTYAGFTLSVGADSLVSSIVSQISSVSNVRRVEIVSGDTIVGGFYSSNNISVEDTLIGANPSVRLSASGSSTTNKLSNQRLGLNNPSVPSVAGAGSGSYWTDDYYKSFDTIRVYDSSGVLASEVEYTSNLTGNTVQTTEAVSTGFVGNYSRVRVSAYSRLRTSAYTGTYSRDRASTYAGDFIGDYARNFAGNYTRSFEGNYARSFLGNYVGATISDSLTNVTETYTLYVRVA